MLCNSENHCLFPSWLPGLMEQIGSMMNQKILFEIRILQTHMGYNSKCTSCFRGQTL